MKARLGGKGNWKSVRRVLDVWEALPALPLTTLHNVQPMIPMPRKKLFGDQWGWKLLRALLFQKSNPSM